MQLLFAASPAYCVFSQHRAISGATMSVFKTEALNEQVIIVTGGGTGIGRQIAQTLGEHGATIAICGRRQDVLQQACEELQDSGIKAFYGSCDIRDAEQVEAFIDEVIQHFGRVDGLINNAAGNFPASIENLSYNGFRTVVDIDLNGTYNMSKAVFSKGMQANGGNIINISAPFEGQGVSWQAHCAAAKSGINSLTRTCAVEWMPLGIRVNAVAPGHIEQTEGVARLAETLTNKQRSKRSGQAVDIANAVLFLLSDAAAFISGQIIHVDGGTGVDALKMPVYPE
jgi:peroxisomal 2,4-dienoyl-CoA reductase